MSVSCSGGVLRPRPTTTPVLVVLLAALLLSSCRGTPAAPAPEEPAPLTQRAVAAVAAERVGTAPASARSTDARRSDPPGEIGAELGFTGDDGWELRVVVSPEPGSRRCGDQAPGSGCAATPVEGGVLRLTWGLLTPEEDPGYVAVSMVRPDGSTTVALTGPAITRDPRSLDLPVPVERMADLAADPRLRLSTTSGVVALGESFGPWQGGEPDPDALERVPSDPESLAVVWQRSLTAFGEPVPRVRAVESSPLVGDGRGWSAPTVSARVSLAPRAGAPYDVLDLLVTRGDLPGRPDALSCDAADPARCAEVYLGTGPHVVRWVPGASGHVEVVRPRGPDTVLARLSGWDVPAAQEQVLTQIGWVGLTAAMGDRVRLGTTTLRRVAEAEIGVGGAAGPTGVGPG